METAATALFLASDAADMINGADLVVDGADTIPLIAATTASVNIRPLGEPGDLGAGT